MFISEEDRYRKAFADLIKVNIVFEDERAADLHVEWMQAEEPQQQPTKKPHPPLKSLRKTSSQLDNSKEAESHFYNISYPRMLERIRDELMAARLTKRHPTHSFKTFMGMLADRVTFKYPQPLEVHCRTTCTAYRSIMMLIQR